MFRFNLLNKVKWLTFCIIIFSLFLGYSYYKNIALAQEQNLIQEDSSTVPAKIQYSLAFPGILPDNPLYKLKVLRDKLSVFFISNPLKRVDYYLLQADKGILATAMLIDKNEIKLAEETALKAENNITLITYELKGLSQKPTADLFTKLETASKKHQEVLNSIIKRVPADSKKTFTTVNNFSKTNVQTIEKLRNKKYYNQQ